ncbi:MAG: type III pantothenate kinase [Candidatus Kapabacteria bacterium]|nr:type III pantothenate kinase [Candidatus Kapabacteria bacterium]
MDTATKLAVDIGNSRIKLYDGTLHYAERHEHTDWQLVGSMLHQYSLIGYSSVHAGIEERLLSVTQGCVRVNMKTIIPTLPHYNNAYPTAGTDRMLGLYAALSFSPNVITVDCGTALTVNAVVENRFIGGVIMPGVTTQSHALHDYTNGLPHVDLRSVTLQNSAVGTTTVSNIATGVILGCSGAVERHLHDISMKHFDSLPAVYLTGGDAVLLHPHIKSYHAISHEPTLVLDGILRVLSTIVT